MRLLFIIEFQLIFCFIQTKILFTNIHFRHGARSSVMNIDKEGYDFLGTKWNDVGELTALGMRQLYFTGIKHREKYSNFLSEEYNSKEILIYSTNMNRTIQSANCYLSGLFSNIQAKFLSEEKEKNSFPPALLTDKMEELSKKLGNISIPKGIQTIPVKIFNKNDHFFLLHDLSYISDCVTIDEIQGKHVNSNKTNILINNFKNKLGNKITNFFKDKNKKFLFNYKYINSFCDHLISNILESSNLSFLEKYDFDIQELNDYCNNFLQYNLEEVECGNKDVVFMSLSPTMRQLILWMDNRIKLDKEGKGHIPINGSPKYTVWSAHDSSLAANEMFFKYIFGTKFVYPIVSSTIIIELHKNDSEQNNTYYIQYYMNDELLLEIDYNLFKTRVLEYLWTDKDIDKFCKFSNISEYKAKMHNYQICLFITFLLLLISLFINSKLFFKLNKLKEEKSEGYELREYLKE